MSKSKFCPHCGTSLAMDAKFCESCGGLIEKIPVCSNGSSTSSLVHQKSSKNQTAVLVTIAVLTTLVAVILAYAVELNTSTIYDGYEIAPASGLHICVIAGLWLIACFFLMPVSKLYETDVLLRKNRLCFHAFFVLTGLFFAAATENGARVKAIEGFDLSMEQAPSWYGGDVVDQAWFAELPDVADKLSESMTVWYALMAVSFVITLYFAVRLFNKQNM